MKQIEINGKAFEIESNAFTFVRYKTIFKTGMMEDLQKIEMYIGKQHVYTKNLKDAGIPDEEIAGMVADQLRPELDEFIIKITQIAWILIYTANEKIEPYEEWLKNIKHFKIDDNWIAEVAELAVNSFC